MVIVVESSLPPLQGQTLLFQRYSQAVRFENVLLPTCFDTQRNSVMDLDLRDHVILVTGGARGIGAQVAKTLAAEGAIPVIIDHHPADNAAAVAAIEAIGNRAVGVE